MNISRIFLFKMAIIALCASSALFPLKKRTRKAKPYTIGATIKNQSKTLYTKFRTNLQKIKKQLQLPNTQKIAQKKYYLASSVSFLTAFLFASNAKKHFFNLNHPERIYMGSKWGVFISLLLSAGSVWTGYLLIKTGQKEQQCSASII